MKLSRRLALLSSLASSSLAALAAPGFAARQKGRNKEPLPVGSPGDTPLGPVDSAAQWAFIQDYTTGAVLLDKHADDQMPPSSMTKLMTMYLVYGQLKKGQIKLTDTLTVSAKAAAMGGSKMFLEVGKPVVVEDLIRGVIVQSGNDAATVLAEAVGGTEEKFVDMMNAKAREIGLTHSVFRNPTGWPDPEQLMSCRDIATLARHIIAEFPEYYKYEFGAVVQIQQHRTAKSPSDGAGRHRGRFEDWPHRCGWFRSGREFVTRRPPPHSCREWNEIHA